MPVSVLTSKGQTTIPKDVRNFLGLEPNDKIFYPVEGERVVLKPLKGNILDLRGRVIFSMLLTFFHLRDEAEITSHP